MVHSMQHHLISGAIPLVQGRTTLPLLLATYHAQVYKYKLDQSYNKCRIFELAVARDMGRKRRRRQFVKRSHHLRPYKGQLLEDGKFRHLRTRYCVLA